MAETPRAAVGATGLTKRFGGVVALDGVDLVLFPGQIVGLIGPNGSGKTTLFNVLTGFVRPDAGTVMVGDRDMTCRAPEDVCRAGIARTFQTSRPFRHMTVEDNVLVALLHAGRRPLRRVRAEAAGLLDQFGLTPLAASPAAGLTLTQRKRLEMARALATGPAVLLLDEVAAGLSAREVDAMGALIDRLRRERELAVCVVEHVMRMVMQISERIVVLDYGQKIAEGPPRAIISDVRVVEAYLGRYAQAAWGRPS
ncbi:MAG TPA: ABC transporter ATP-binding protein [bacterium]|nr:ABC transporter ATP-binding protein [bacterium]